MHTLTRLHPLERLLDREIDLTRLPDADDMDEITVRIEALEQQIALIQQSMGARIASLGQALSQTQTQLKALAPQAQLGAAIPGLAHDLNSALGNSSLSANVMQDQLADFQRSLASGPVRRSELTALLDNFTEGLRIVTTSSRYAAEAIGSLKNVAIDSANPRVRAFDLDTVLTDVLATVQPALRQAQATVSITRDNAVSTRLHGCPGTLARVLHNLINNAVVHGFAPLTDARARQLTIHLGGDDECVLLHLADNGAGMDEHVLSQVFTPYFTTRAAQGGTGLGLSQARQMIEGEWHGRLMLTSTPDIGSEFTLILPRVCPV
jgi:two-component system, NtrC family, sensor kinase